MITVLYIPRNVATSVSVANYEERDRSIAEDIYRIWIRYNLDPGDRIIFCEDGVTVKSHTIA